MTDIESANRVGGAQNRPGGKAGRQEGRSIIRETHIVERIPVSATADRKKKEDPSCLQRCMNCTGFAAALWSLWDAFWSKTFGKILCCCGPEAAAGVLGALVTAAIVVVVVEETTDLVFLRKEKECAFAPINDLCENAISLPMELHKGSNLGVLQDPVFGTTVPASLDDTCKNVQDNQIVTSVRTHPLNSPGVWYSVNLTELSGPLRISADVCQADFESRISFFHGDCSLPTCLPSIPGERDCNEILYNHDAARNLLILVHGAESNITGNFVLGGVQVETSRN